MACRLRELGPFPDGCRRLGHRGGFGEFLRGGGPLPLRVERVSEHVAGLDALGVAGHEIGEESLRVGRPAGVEQAPRAKQADGNIVPLCGRERREGVVDPARASLRLG